MYPHVLLPLRASRRAVKSPIFVHEHHDVADVTCGPQKEYVRTTIEVLRSRARPVVTRFRRVGDSARCGRRIQGDLILGGSRRHIRLPLIAIGRTAEGPRERDVLL